MCELGTRRELARAFVALARRAGTEVELTRGLERLDAGWVQALRVRLD